MSGIPIKRSWMRAVGQLLIEYADGKYSLKKAGSIPLSVKQIDIPLGYHNQTERWRTTVGRCTDCDYIARYIVNGDRYCRSHAGKKVIDILAEPE